MRRSEHKMVQESAMECYAGKEVRRRLSSDKGHFHGLDEHLVVVQNLPGGITEAELREFLGTCGLVLWISSIVPGCVVARFQHKLGVSRAVARLNGYLWHGQPIHVQGYDPESKSLTPSVGTLHDHIWGPSVNAVSVASLDSTMSAASSRDTSSESFKINATLDGSERELVPCDSSWTPPVGSDSMSLCQPLESSNSDEMLDSCVMGYPMCRRPVDCEKIGMEMEPQKSLEQIWEQLSNSASCPHDGCPPGALRSQKSLNTTAREDQVKMAALATLAGPTSTLIPVGSGTSPWSPSLKYASYGSSFRGSSQDSNSFSQCFSRQNSQSNKMRGAPSSSSLSRATNSSENDMMVEAYGKGYWGVGVEDITGGPYETPGMADPQVPINPMTGLPQLALPRLKVPAAAQTYKSFPSSPVSQNPPTRGKPLNAMCPPFVPQQGPMTPADTPRNTPVVSARGPGGCNPFSMGFQENPEVMSLISQLQNCLAGTVVSPDSPVLSNPNTFMECFLQALELKDGNQSPTAGYAAKKSGGTQDSSWQGKQASAGEAALRSNGPLAFPVVPKPPADSKMMQELSHNKALLAKLMISTYTYLHSDTMKLFAEKLSLVSVLYDQMHSYPVVQKRRQCAQMDTMKEQLLKDSEFIQILNTICTLRSYIYSVSRKVLVLNNSLDGIPVDLLVGSMSSELYHQLRSTVPAEVTDFFGNQLPHPSLAILVFAEFAPVDPAPVANLAELTQMMA